MIAIEPLTPEERGIIEGKGTEPPFSGAYNNFFQEGTYACRKCGAPLYPSQAKFNAGCGWPAFDAAIPETVIESADEDGFRTEIQCANCKGHLGHIFRGERLTQANTRHCVNSLSMCFIPAHTCSK